MVISGTRSLPSFAAVRYIHDKYNGSDSDWGWRCLWSIGENGAKWYWGSQWIWIRKMINFLPTMHGVSFMSSNPAIIYIYYTIEAEKGYKQYLTLFNWKLPKCVWMYNCILFWKFEVNLWLMNSQKSAIETIVIGAHPADVFDTQRYMPSPCASGRFCYRSRYDKGTRLHDVVISDQMRMRKQIPRMKNWQISWMKRCSQRRWGQRSFCIMGLMMCVFSAVMTTSAW